MNKVVFLDVDGMLNNGNWAMEMFDKGICVYHDGKPRLSPRSPLCESCVKEDEKRFSFFRTFL